MAELMARSALASASFQAGGISLAERPGLSAWLITSSQMPEALLIDVNCPAKPSGTGLVQDMSSALTFIEINGPGLFDLLGLSVVASADSGATATRLAELRVFIEWRRTPHAWLRIAVDRFSADYLWKWLVYRIGTNNAVG